MLQPLEHPAHRPCCCRSSTPAPDLDQHNLMRIKTMSEKALRTRIWKIRREDKLHSFVKVRGREGEQGRRVLVRQSNAQFRAAAQPKLLLLSPCSQLLEGCGMAELAEEAREALQQLTGGAVPG